MATSLANCRILLSKGLGDYWASASTSAGVSGGSTIIDTALKAKAGDWITDEAYTLITESEDSSEDDERKILNLVSSDGALGTLAHTAQIGSGIDYEIHRLFSASEKRRALIHAAKAGFPFIFDEIRDQGLTAPASTTDRVDISSLGLAQNRPHQVWQKPTADILQEPWIFLRNWYVGSDGYLYCREWTKDYTLRIIGIGYLDFLKSGAVSTAWDATIDIDSPQTDILIAEAALWLCEQKLMPTGTRGTSEQWQIAYVYWKDELRERRSKFGMESPVATVHWGI